MNDSLCFCTVLSDNFVAGFKVLLYSLQKYNEGFAYPFVIFYDDYFSILSDQNIEELRIKYNFLQFKKIDSFKYIWLKESTAKKRFIPSFYTIESFALKEYNTVIFLDSDMLCLNSIDPLINLNEGKYLTVTYDCRGYVGGKIVENGKSTFNGGFLYIPNEFLQNDTYDRLFNFCKNNHSLNLAEQSAMNLFFKGTTLRFLSTNYNTFKRRFRNRSFDRYKDDLKDVIFLHYVGKKPWSQPPEKAFSKIDTVWVKHFNEMCNHGK
jgi:lipopolysaccharide biosynthesis glycosyltransferase